MRVVILVPRRADHGHRDEVWAWVRTELKDLYDWPIYEGHDEGPGLFCKAAAVNRAACEAGNWDLAVITDADVVAPGWPQAVEATQETGRYTIPHTNYCYLREDATHEILAGRDHPRPELTEWSEENLCVAQCVVTREVWDRVGGFDERFVGWGWQDVAFYYACRALVGEMRIEGPLWHLWHPDQPKHLDPPQNRDMGLEYMAAFQEGRMEALLDARRGLDGQGRSRHPADHPSASTG